jgi:peptide subunit release factor 1 (eRF1)
MRYQRHIEDHRHRHHREVAEHLVELFDSGHWKRIVLIGQDHTIANFKALLPERIKQNLTDSFPMDFSEERSKVLKRLFERLLQRERERVNDEVHAVVEKAPQGGLATLGLPGVLEALSRGQIHTLYLLTSFFQPGGKCTRCQVLIPISSPEGTSTPCPLCKDETRGVDLGEEMTRSVLRQDGEVKWVNESPLLGEHDGVGASLRFR